MRRNKAVDQSYEYPKAMPPERALAYAVIEDAFRLAHRSPEIGLHLADINERYASGRKPPRLTPVKRDKSDPSNREAMRRYRAREARGKNEDAWLFLLGTHPAWVASRRYWFDAATLPSLSVAQIWRGIEFGWGNREAA